MSSLKAKLGQNHKLGQTCLSWLTAPAEWCFGDNSNGSRRFAVSYICFASSLEGLWDSSIFKFPVNFCPLGNCVPLSLIKFQLSWLICSGSPRNAHMINERGLGLPLTNCFKIALRCLHLELPQKRSHEMHLSFYSLCTGACCVRVSPHAGEGRETAEIYEPVEKGLCEDFFNLSWESKQRGCFSPSHTDV